MKIKSIERVGNSVRLIDQTKLPKELVYRTLDDYREIVGAIKRLEIRGAPAIGIAAAYTLAIAVQQVRDGSPTTVKRLADEIKAARPTAVNLFWAIDRATGTVISEEVWDYRAVADRLWDEAERIHDEDRQMCARIGQFGADLIQDGNGILTHCNTGALATGGIGTALGVIYTCRDQGKRLRVYADETRPLLQGARLTAWELQQEGIDVTLICDNMAAVLMRQGKVNHVIVGADRIARNGDTANKIGTYGLAVLANHHGIPFYVAAPTSTFDEATATGRQIVIEERGAEEITNGFGKRTAPEGIRVYSPAFDVTPHELISCYITDSGIRPGGRQEAQ
ncbi:S-methyl-5-thioribose-1-phosphate isomerase [candidate division GN15 bacterium]|uniref:Methylthioribose-1-phosphate isomerase n=1 Tax=candidate division GN15 bacterium TaxID=2072418 RepID=A0A855X307_9BACT|nr:MAG: S-methyl-5-thioribose-1-phosphate isomerase [candidate division GN15 bacterium]